MQKKKIAIFGGAFDPITIKGHLNIAKKIKEFSDIDEVWITPTFKSLYKDLSSFSHRKKMIENLIKKENYIKFFNYELDKDFEGKTYNLIKSLKSNKTYDNYDFYFIIGADNANGIYRWYKYKELLKILSFIIVKRNSFEIEKNAWYTKKPHQIIKEEITTDISSTFIRENIYKDNMKKEMIENISKLNYDYILKHNIYLKGSKDE